MTHHITKLAAITTAALLPAASALAHGGHDHTHADHGVFEMPGIGASDILLGAAIITALAAIFMARARSRR